MLLVLPNYFEHYYYYQSDVIVIIHLAPPAPGLSSRCSTETNLDGIHFSHGREVVMALGSLITAISRGQPHLLY